MCSGEMSGQPARSAIVRASLMMRVQARAESPILLMMRSISDLHAGLNGQYFSICLLFMAELQNMPSPPFSNLFICVSRALCTLAETSALDSAVCLSTNLRGSTGDIQSCMSIRSMIGPESFDRYAILLEGVHEQRSPSP